MRQYKPIRVTTVLSWVESAWKEYWFRNAGFEAADKITKESSEFGTRVHTLVGELLCGEESGGLDIHSPEGQCASAILGYLGKIGAVPHNKNWKESLEITVEDKKLGLIGHLDLLIKIPSGEAIMIDFKTSKQMRKSFPLQKAAYAKMLKSQEGVIVDRGLTIRAHWDEEKQVVDFEVKEYTDLRGKYWKLFKMCLDIYKYFTNRSREGRLPEYVLQLGWQNALRLMLLPLWRARPRTEVQVCTAAQGALRLWRCAM